MHVALLQAQTTSRADFTAAMNKQSSASLFVVSFFTYAQLRERLRPPSFVRGVVKRQLWKH
jgi:hypothetical protein